MSAWFDLYLDHQGQKALYEIADLHQLTKVFTLFQRGLTISKAGSTLKLRNHTKADKFRSHNLSAFTFGLLKLFLAS